MDSKWNKVARRIVEGLGVQPGELIDVRDNTGCLDLLLETCLAVEQAGATPLVQLHPADYLERLWADLSPATLARWDERRGEWMKQVDRVAVLAGARSEPDRAPRAAVQAWREARQRLTIIEEARRLPYLLAAIPTGRGAEQLGWTYAEFEEILLPALAVSAEELQDGIERALGKLRGAQVITIHSGEQHVLHLEHGERAWLSDDGLIDEQDRRRGAVVSNLPAGSVYTTVLEDRTKGSLWLPRAGQAKDVTLTFDAGRIVDIHAGSGAELITGELDSHSGEARRVSHIGIGLNPYLTRPTGWTIVDEHIHGAMFIALGENRYMGGQNESSLNEDYALPGVTLMADGETVILAGKVMV